MAASLKIWVAIYPSLMLFQFLFGTYLAEFPLYIRTFLLTIALVPWVMFVGVPVINFLICKITGIEKV